MLRTMRLIGIRTHEYPCAFSRPKRAREGASGAPFRVGVTRANKNSGRIPTRGSPFGRARRLRGGAGQGDAGQGVPTPGSTSSPKRSMARRCILSISRAMATSAARTPLGSLSIFRSKASRWEAGRRGHGTADGQGAMGASEKGAARDLRGQRTRQVVSEEGRACPEGVREAGRRLETVLRPAPVGKSG